MSEGRRTMTREEAIETLEIIRDEYRGFESFEPRMPALALAIEALKEPEREKGKWLWIGNNCFCGECHRPVYGIIGDYKYCPYCGAEMEEEDGKIDR